MKYVVSSGKLVVKARSSIHDTVTTWSVVRGDVEADAATLETTGATAKFTVDMTQFDAGDFLKNRKLRKDFEMDAHPQATFELTKVKDVVRDAGGFTVARADRAPELPYLLPPCTLVPERIRDLNIYTFVDGRSQLPFAHFSPGPAQLLLEHWINCLVDGPDLQRPLLDLLASRDLLREQTENSGPLDPTEGAQR